MHSRSLSRSPVRHARDFDPLLRNLSPTATLRAFSHAPTYVPTGSGDVLSKSVETASPAQRALGVQAARTCLHLRSWTRELESWEWPGTFDLPEPARKRQRISVMSLGTLASGRTSVVMPEEDEEFWGSLPAETVQAYEERVDEIGQELDDVDVEGLKGYVLSAHKAAGSGEAGLDDSIGAIGAATDLQRLDDFTAVVTATILQALPYLSRLHRLLDTWTMRLSILHKASDYVSDLIKARTDLDHGWAAIAVSSNPRKAASRATFSPETMLQMRNALEIQVSSLGRRLDRFLDELEGRQEAVPEAWIEDFEDLERTYGSWVVQAERKVLEDEWRMSRDDSLGRAAYAEADQHLTDGGAEPEASRPSISDVENPTKDADSLFSPSSRPVSGVFDVPDTDKRASWHLPGIITPREVSATHTPQNERVDEYELGATRQPESKPGLPSIDELAPSPTKYQKHVPIVIDYDPANTSIQDQVDGDPQQLGGADNEDEATAAQEPNAEAKPISIKKRSAFLAANVEKAENLQRQSKTPVRPFEHASNAFTRLFKRGSISPEQSRSNSQKSNTSSKRNSKESGDSIAAGIMWAGRKPLAALSNGNKKANVNEERQQAKRSSSAKRPAGPVARYSGQDGGRVVTRDYADMPGGFPRRFSEDIARQPRSRSRSRSSPQHLQHQRSVPETYKPKRLSSLTDSEIQRQGATDQIDEKEPDYPADWPLASPPDTQPTSPVNEVPEALPQSIFGKAIIAHVEQPDEDEGDASFGPEIRTPQQAIGSDVFDRMFVQSMPSSPNERLSNPMEKAPVVPRRSSSLSRGSRSRSRTKSSRSSRSVIPTLDELMLGGIDEGSRKGKEREARQDRLNELVSSLPMPQAGEDATPGSISSEITIGELQDAQESDYFRNPSSPHASTNSASKQKRSSASPLLRLKIPGSPTADDFAGDVADDEAERKNKPDLIHRASVASIESHPRSQLKSIDVSARRGSVSSGGTRSAPLTPAKERGESEPVSASTPLTYMGAMFPSPAMARVHDGERRGGSLPTSPVSLIEGDSMQSQSKLLDTTALNAQPAGRDASPGIAETIDAPAPLNAAMAKRQHGKAAAANGKIISPKPAKGPLKPGEDSFDRHVSEVLERLPAPIKFKSRPGAETPNSRTSEPRNYVGPRPKANRVTSRAGAGDLTLAPAGPSPRKSASAGEPDVKLYHLTQQGRDEPIKLFVRLVGEGERVMVRVGGGWADLADYLRQYAEHHGSRTASGGGIEVQTAEGNGAGGGPNGKRSVSGPVSSKTPLTPISAAPEWLQEDQPRFSMGDGSTPTDDDDSPIHFQPHHTNSTPTNTIATQRSTPKSASTGRGSRPSTGNSDGRPSSRQGVAGVGMAGLGGGGKRGDLSEQKAKWVEGMIERAKQASAEKTRDDRERSFGEMDKAGTTRRVVFRQSSGAGPEGPK